MKYLKYALWSLVVSVSAFAVAQAVGSVSRINDPKPQHFVNGFYLGDDTKNPLSTTINKKAYHLCGQVTEDFPSTTGTHANCRESAAVTLTGCALGDRMSLGVGATYNAALVQFHVEQTAASTAKVVMCANGITDGGSYDMASTTYTVCCDGN